MWQSRIAARGAAFSVLLVIFGSLMAPVYLCAQESAIAAASTAWVDRNWDTSKARGEPRDIDFITDEGTGMSVDVSPDGTTLLFDLLGDIYRLPAGGGVAKPLLDDSGIALNFHPTFSPSGRYVAFVSDRRGQNALWVVGVDGDNLRQIFLDPDTRISEPRWSPDGKRIAAVRSYPTPGRGYHRLNAQIWEFDAQTGAAQPLVHGTTQQYNAPSYSADGQYLYFHTSDFSGNRYGTQLRHRVQRLTLATGLIETVTNGGLVKVLSSAAEVGDDEDHSPASVVPLPSPDGRYLAFAREDTNQTIRHRGHELGPRTVLVVRDMVSGRETVVIDPANKDLTSAHAMYSYSVFPRYAWGPESRHLYISVAGKLRRVDVSSGQTESIPFSARVQRRISEQVRGQTLLNDEPVESRFLQWASSSPDGQRLAFVAFGQVWVSTPNGQTPRVVVERDADTVQLTPSWSADGQQLTYATWVPGQRGHLWLTGLDGSQPTRLTEAPGEYLYPSLTADKRYLVFARGADVSPIWNGWEVKDVWRISTLDRESGEIFDIAQTGILREPLLGPDGRVYFEYQSDPAAAAGLWQPYPSDDALRQRVRLRSLNIDGGDQRDHLELPVSWRDRGTNRPSISPSGQWAAFETTQSIYVVPLDGAAEKDAAIFVDTDVNRSTVAERIDRLGGRYHRWLDDETIEYTSGNNYVRYSLRSKQHETSTIQVQLPRAQGTGAIAFTNAKVITSDQQGVIESGDVVVVDRRIQCVGRCDIGDETVTIDATGMTIVPGYVDVHAHNTLEYNSIIPTRRPKSAAYLAYGVTTVVDPGLFVPSAFPLAELTEIGAVRGPRVFSVAEMVVSKGLGFGSFKEVQTLEDALYEAGSRRRLGAVSLKNFRPGRRDQAQKLIAAARRYKMSVTGEGGPLYYVISTVMDGQTGWEHYLADLPIYSDVARFIGMAGSTYSPTALVAGHGAGSVQYFRDRDLLHKDPKYVRLAGANSLWPESERPVAPFSEYSFPIVAEGLKDIRDAGGFGAIGDHTEQIGLGSIWEIQGYATALDPVDAIRVATIEGARFHGLERDIGSLTRGKIADLVVLDGDVELDIKAIEAVRFVMKDGVLYDADTLDRVWPDQDTYDGVLPTHSRNGTER